MDRLRGLWPLISKLLIIGIALVAYGYIAHRLYTFDGWTTLFDTLQWHWGTLLMLLGIVTLFFLNSLCEAAKWRLLMRPFHTISIKKSLCQVFAGTVTAVGSPGRIAEPGGRMALLPKEHRGTGFVMTILGGIMQNAIITLFGLSALYYSSNRFEKWISIAKEAGIPAFFTILIIITLLAISIYIIISRKPVLWIKQLLSQVKKVRKVLLIKALGWTTLRFSIFNAQLMIWFIFYQQSVDIRELCLILPVYYFFITILPSHILIDMGMRGSVALLVFSELIVEEPVILSAVFSQWFVNVIIPTLGGSYVLLRYQQFRERN